MIRAERSASGGWLAEGVAGTVLVLVVQSARPLALVVTGWGWKMQDGMSDLYLATANQPGVDLLQGMIDTKHQ